MTIEFVFATLNCTYICSVYIITIALDYHLKDLDYGLRHFFGFQGYCCLGIIVLFPLFMILSLWKRGLSIAKYVFLFIGSLCILSGMIAFPIACFANIEKHYTLLLLFHAVWGIGFIVRYWFSRKYESSFYSATLFKCYKKDSHDFHMLLNVLVLYEAVYITLFLITLSETSRC